MMVFASNSNVQLAAVNTSHPHSQSSSPSSPTANFVAQQVLPSQSPYPTTASKISASNLRSGSRPSTPVQNTLVNGLAVATTSIISESPPPGMTYADFVRTWSDEHISRWLADHKCVAHATIFKENDIRGDVILDLDQQTLKEMGISSLGDRIRIINAVKALRQKCAARNTVISSITVSTPLYSPRATLNGIDYHSPIIPPNVEEEHYVNGRSEESSSSATRHRGRPAPLQLRQTQVNDLPRIAQSGPESARSTTGSANRNFNQSLIVGFTPSNLTATPNASALSSTSSNSSGSSASRAGLPPLPPPPRSQPPLPPANSRSAPRLHAIATQHSGRRTPTQTDAPHYVTQPLPPAPHGPPPQPPTLLAPSSTSQSNVNWKGEYGLPSGPRSGNVSSGQQPNRSISPLPIQGQSRSSPQVSHAKNSSFSGLSSSPSNKAPIRPATSNSVTANPSHPYASPQVLQPPPNSSFNLSPIAESFVSHHTALSTGVPSPPTASTSASSSSGSAYTANRTQYNRPTTPSHAAAPSLEDLRRKLVRFFLADDGHSATISVADCLTGEAVLEKVLKKFGKLGSRKAESDTSLEGTDPDEMNVLYVDGWCVCLDGVGEDGSGKPLSEAELLSVCHAGPDHPAREHGLTVRRAGKPKRSKPLQQIFGEAPPFHNQSQSPDSPTSPFFVSPRPGSADEEDSNSPALLNQSTSQSLSASQTLDAKSTKRASSISVLSALGVRDPERVLERSASPSAPSASISNTGKSPSASSFTSRIRSSLGGRFRGQRPPSELIATHLQDFFPYTEKKVLQKTARQSMLRTSGISGIGSLGRRDSAGSWNPQTSHSRFSTSTQGSRQRASMSPSRVSMSSLPPPPVPEKLTPSRSAETAASDEPPKVSLSTDDGHSIELHGDDQQTSISKPLHLLPPVDFPSESLSDAFIAEAGARTGSTPSISRTTSNASRRMSYITELRSKRDRSDTASMLTVDEITAEVENRRKSLTIESTDSFTVVEMEDGEDDQEESVRRSVALSIPKRYSQLTETEEEEEVDEEYDEDEDEDEDETLENEEIEDEDEDEHGKAMTSAGGKRVIKWIKGALIGAGSFGSVYLGLDAQSGLLMAVKQVELPTGSGANEERKKSMLNALEREIDLLKDLQHENIVQYLDSSSDDRYLNIFLEYVPGGSVTALLKSYGAFEEALVRNFVRQILTGLCYLHDREIIHRDIKGANILVDNKGGVKISDFGISKKVEGELLTGPRVHRPSLQGSVFWMAPEVVKQTSYTRKADIWSVGCLVVEMLTGQHPYPQLSQMQAIFKIGSSSKPTIPSDISVDAVDFLQKTFEIDHESRPDAVQLLQHPWILNDPANAVRSKLQKVI